MLALAALALGACAVPQDPVRSELWRERQQQFAVYDSWHLRARAAITRQAEAYNVGISWKHDPAQSMLLLDAPFGQGVFRIDRAQNGDYRLRLPDGGVFVNQTPEALLEDVIGWSLPISGLEYWIRGLPHPDSEYRHRLDAGGRARSISQDRWDIDYLDYFAAAPEPPLPRRIRLARDEVTLKLVIERWQQYEVEPTPSDLFPEFN